MKISLIRDVDELPVSVNRAALPNNGRGRVMADYIVIDWGDGRVDVHSDAMEPEDAIFRRDLDWIVDALKETRRAALLEAAKAVCKWCNNERIGYKNLMWVPGEGGYCHGWSGPLCLASAIHALLAQEQAHGAGR